MYLNDYGFTLLVWNLTPSQNNVVKRNILEYHYFLNIKDAPNIILNENIQFRLLFRNILKIEGYYNAKMKEYQFIPNYKNNSESPKSMAPKSIKEMMQQLCT